MAMTSGTTFSPTRRRKLVWSHHTSYPAASGLHSEVSKRGQSIHLAGQQQLQARLSLLHTTHHKELRRLHRHRKTVESSMLAYAQKMKEIFAERFPETSSPASRHSVSLPARDTFPVHSGSGKSSSGSSESLHTSSAGSDTEVMKNWARKGGRIHRSSLPALKLSPTVTQRPISSEKTIGNISSEQIFPLTDPKRKAFREADSTSRRLQQRRHSIAASISVMTEDEESAADVRRVSSSSSLAITPFPEIAVTVEQAFDSPTEEETHIEDTSSPSPRHSPKGKKAKDNYWGSQKEKPKRKVVTTKIKPHPKPVTSLSSPRHVAPRRVVKKPTAKQNSKPQKSLQPVKTNHLHSFRYSEAVGSILQAFEDSWPETLDRRTIRRASETLPSLDLQDLRQASLRLREESRRNSVVVIQDSELSSGSTSPDPQQNGELSNKENLPWAMPQERSLQPVEDIGELPAEENGREEEANNTDSEEESDNIYEKFNGVSSNDNPVPRTVSFLPTV